MKELILLYWGCVFLMYLSQVYYPVEYQLSSHRGRSFMRCKTDLFMVLTIAWMTCFSFLRTSYNDTGNYIYMWETAPEPDVFIQNGGLADVTGNPLSLFWQSISHSIVLNYHVYFLLPAFLSSFAVVKIFKRYSINPAFSLLIFFSIGTYILYVAALKQCFAMFFLLLALPYALDKKYIRFYLLVVVAILFHTHAFMFALVPFLTGRPWGKVTWGGLFAVIFLMVTYQTTMRKFMEIAHYVGAFVAEDEVFDGHQINIIRVMVYWIIPLLALFFKQRLFSDSSKCENLFVNMAIVAAFILSVGTVEGANLYARMAGYFEIAAAIALPWMINKLFTKQSAQMITFIGIFLYFGYFLFEFGVSKNFGEEYSAISLWQFIVELSR